jgi:hypothetical protein
MRATSRLRDRRGKARQKSFKDGLSDKPYENELGCTCGAGIPCKCNDSDPPDTSRVIVVGPTLH